MRFGVIGDGADQGADIHRRILKRGQHGAQCFGADGWEIALKVDHHIELPGRVQGLHGALHPIRARGHILGHQNSFCPGGAGGGGNFFFRTGDRQRPNAGFPGAVQYMCDHGFTMNMRQWLPGKAGCGHARRDDDDGTHGKGLLPPCRRERGAIWSARSKEARPAVQTGRAQAV